MSTAPYVELHADLPSRITQLDGRIGSPAEQIEAALSSYRLLVINYAKREMARFAEPKADQLIKVTDLAAQLYLKQFSKLVGPVALQTYTRAYAESKAGHVPPSILYALAEEHAERMGKYFNDTSRDALAQGFNTYVNRRLPARTAADRVLDAFGLSPRQMSGYTSIEAPQAVNSANALNLKARALQYVGKSFRQRAKIFATQELHNLDYQARQTAWLWLQNQGNLSATASKIWLTARDEKTCSICGPMHGKTVLVSEQFELPNGYKVWVPGVHPNCRCEVRVRDLELLRKDLSGGELEEFNDEHPRGKGGRFSAKARASDVLRQRAAASPYRFRPLGYADPVPGAVIPAEVIETTQYAEAPTMYAAPVQQIAEATTAAEAPTIAEAPTTTFADAPVATYSDAPGAVVTNTVPEVAEMVRTKEPLRNLIEYDEIEDVRDGPYYAVSTVSPEWDENRQFSEELFTQDRDQAIRDATAARQEMIGDYVDEIVAGDYARQIYPQMGNSTEIRIPKEEFQNIVEAIAQNDTHDPAQDALLQVDLYDPESDEDSGPLDTVGMTITDVAHAFGISPEDFHVHIMQLETVHSNDVGRGNSYPTTLPGGFRQYYSVTGDYMEESPEYSATTTPIGIDFYTLRPKDPAHGIIEGDDVTWVDQDGNDLNE